VRFNDFSIFKLSQGEYIAPEKSEMKIKTANILQSFVYGDSMKSCLVAIVIPDPETGLIMSSYT
jgi:long-chain acyl-CoA synthetase